MHAVVFLSVCFYVFVCVIVFLSVCLCVLVTGRWLKRLTMVGRGEDAVGIHYKLHASEQPTRNLIKRDSLNIVF